ncbi:hypothetical protein E2C01_028690 [Portunus trituberculatus]|uniref:Uncharacterized protein n=1 Tax=Portunus trituberculatus TaxID=210409 RepID=A0A5B7EQ60_PORTR|nr:hypothetical protein [Portunus trituberculatus]
METFFTKDAGQKPDTFNTWDPSVQSDAVGIYSSPIAADEELSSQPASAVANVTPSIVAAVKMLTAKSALFSWTACPTSDRIQCETTFTLVYYS